MLNADKELLEKFASAAYRVSKAIVSYTDNNARINSIHCSVYRDANYITRPDVYRNKQWVLRHSAVRVTVPYMKSITLSEVIAVPQYAENPRYADFARYTKVSAELTKNTALQGSAYYNLIGNIAVETSKGTLNLYVDMLIPDNIKSLECIRLSDVRVADGGYDTYMLPHGMIALPEFEKFMKNMA